LDSELKGKPPLRPYIWYLIIENKPAQNIKHAKNMNTKGAIEDLFVSGSKLTSLLSLS
jgi:hypothetical protein